MPLISFFKSNLHDAKHYFNVVLENFKHENIGSPEVPKAHTAFTLACCYIRIFGSRSPELEQYFIKDPLAVTYAVSILNERWLEAEPYILNSKHEWSRYFYETTPGPQPISYSLGLILKLDAGKFNDVSKSDIIDYIKIKQLKDENFDVNKFADKNPEVAYCVSITKEKEDPRAEAYAIKDLRTTAEYLIKTKSNSAVVREIVLDNLEKLEDSIPANMFNKLLNFLQIQPAPRNIQEAERKRITMKSGRTIDADIVIDGSSKGLNPNMVWVGITPAQRFIVHRSGSFARSSTSNRRRRRIKLPELYDIKWYKDRFAAQNIIKPNHIDANNAGGYGTYHKYNKILTINKKNIVKIENIT